MPLWGQSGEFTVAVEDMRVRIDMDGMFGIGTTFCLFPGFAARAADPDRTFLSETGFLSFIDTHAAPVPGMTVDEFVSEVIAAHVPSALNGRLRAIKPEYRRG